MRYLIVHIVVLLLLLASSCNKDEPYTSPVINIQSPQPYETIELPGAMQVQLSVVSNYELKYVKVSVDDANIQPIFEPSFFYPEARVAELDFSMNLGQVPPGKTKPYYLHVSVDDGIEMNHYYQEIGLENTVPKQVIGVYLISRPSIGKTRIDYLDDENKWKLVDEINGEYLDAEEYSQHNLFYVATVNPSIVAAYEFDEEQQVYPKWQHFPELPYAEITDLMMHETALFAGSANGTIDGLDYLTGIKKISTDIAQDSIPKKIGASNYHIIGDFFARKSNTNALQSFYMATGYFIQRKGIYFSVVDFYPASEEDSFYFFGNTSVNGLFGRYHVPTNSTFQMQDFDKGVITHTVKVNGNEYVFCTGSELFRFKAAEGLLTQLIATEEPVEDLEIDKTSEDIYVCLSTEVHVYSYPAMELKRKIFSDYPLKGVKLRYNY